MASTEHIVSYTTEEIDAMIARGEDRTDWERVRNMTDEEIEASIDHEEEGEFDWDTASLPRNRLSRPRSSSPCGSTRISSRGSRSKDRATRRG